MLVEQYELDKRLGKSVGENILPNLYDYVTNTLCGETADEFVECYLVAVQRIFSGLVTAENLRDVVLDVQQDYKPHY